MEGHIKSETIKGEKSGFGRAWPPLAYEKVMVARTLFVILLGLFALIFFGN